MIQAMPHQPAAPDTQPKQLCNVWLIAAAQVLATLDLAALDDSDDALALFTDTHGTLFAADPANPPEHALYVCLLRSTSSPVTVAARLANELNRHRAAHLPAKVGGA